MIEIDSIKGKILKHTNDKFNSIPEIKTDGLYNLSKYYKKGELDFIYSNSFNDTKFYKILLKEWWYYLKKGGKILIDFKGNKILNFLGFTKILKLFFAGEYIFEYFDLGNNIIRIEITKITEKNYENDDINTWTFGIITNGKRIDWIEKVIKSIISQNIPNFEIIISGYLIEKSIIEKYNLKYIEFTEKDDLGWITKKKNLIVENAKYENLMIMHDKIILDENWFEGMKKYGNNFESLSCVTLNTNNKRYSDWKVVLGRDLYYIKNKIYSKIRKNVDKGILKENLWFDQYYLNYNDWDENSVVIGHFNIIKKRVAKIIPWDENLYWNCAEDIALSQDLSLNGFLNKFNPFSKVVSMNYRQAEHPIISFNSKKLGKIKGQFILRILFFIVKLIKKSGFDCYLQPLIDKIKRSNVYKKIIK